MGLFKKDKMPSRKASKGNEKVLSKYLPTTLFVGVQEDVNEKALIGYITSLSQSAFNNLKEVKFSIKKLGKNRYIYEVHNGSQDLTYLPLVIKHLIEGTDSEIILKTQGQNVRVVKKTATKIESNTLISSNNRDDDAISDLETKGKLKILVRQGTEFLIFSIIASSISCVLAGSSFFSKYYMLNEDYTYNPNIPETQTAYEYLMSLDDNQHNEYRYLKNISYKNRNWTTEYIELPKPEPKPEPVEVVPENTVTEEPVINDLPVIPSETINNQDVVKDVMVDAIESKDVALENSDIIEPTVIEAIATPVIQEPITDIVDKEELIVIAPAIESLVQEPVIVEPNVIEHKTENVVEPVNKTTLESSVVVEPSVDITVDNSASIADELMTDEMILESSQESNNTEFVISEGEVVIDEFEIVDAVAVEGLELSNLPDNVVLEEGED